MKVVNPTLTVNQSTWYSRCIVPGMLVGSGNNYHPHYSSSTKNKSHLMHTSLQSLDNGRTGRGAAPPRRCRRHVKDAMADGARSGMDGQIRGGAAQIRWRGAPAGWRRSGSSLAPP